MLNLRPALVSGYLLFAHFLISAQCPITVNAGEDIYLCAPPQPTELNGDISGDYMSFNWTPTTGMIGSHTLSPTVTVFQNSTYVLSASALDLDNNLVSNGDFEGGAGGFDSDYLFSPGNLVPEGLYDVVDNPKLDHVDFAACNDHTSGSGNMMVVNGAGVPNQNVWCQTVPVNPNSQYVLSAWVTSVVTGSPALLQFNINGTPLGGIFNAPGGTCVWQNYFQIWNSGGATSATICIVNQNTTLGGNDFALDDIVFSPLCTVTDTVKVFVINVAAVAAPSLVVIPCDGAPATLSGAGSSTGPNISYEWTTDVGNIVSGANTLNPSVNAPGEYTLTVSYSINGDVICTKTSTVTVVLSQVAPMAWINPPQPLGCGSPTTTLIGNSNQPGLLTYEWTTPDGNIVSGSDQKNCTVNQIGTYALLVTNTTTGCTATTEVHVTITNNVPTAVAVSNGVITCANDTVPLLGTGSSSGANIHYSWTSITGHIAGHSDSLNTFASAGGFYILHVTNTSNNCTSNDTVIVPANLTLPSVSSALPPQISCDPNQDTISLFINVGPPPFVLINWTTTNGNIVSGQYTPAPQADQPGIYTVSVFDPANGCYNYDTSQVLANFTVPMADILPADTVTCQFPSIQLQGNGSTVGANFSIDWVASNGGNIVSGNHTLNPNVNAAGDYLLILRDSVSLCADTAMVSVLADTNVVVAIANAPDTLNCLIHNVSLDANGSSSGGNLTYVWSTTTGHISGGQDTPNPTVDAPGIYQLLLTNNTNGCSATDLAEVIQSLSPPQIAILLPDTLTCAVPTRTILAQNNSGPGNFSYLWTSSNGGNILSGDSSLTPTVNQPGTYTLTTTNLFNGCTASSSVTVVQEAGAPLIALDAPQALTCIAASQVLGSGGSSMGPNFSYLWSTPDGNISLGADSPNPTVTEAGTYSLQITNLLNGCTIMASTLVVQDTVAPLALILTPADTLTCLSTQLELLGDGNGNGLWTTGNGHIIFTGGYTAQIDAPGSYVFTTTDPNNGCTSTATVQVFENVQIPALSIAAPSILNCFNSSLNLVSNTSGQNLQFAWQSNPGNIISGANTGMVLIDAPGSYELMVTDSENGCSATSTVQVDQDTLAPDISIAPTLTITCNTPVVQLEGQNNSLPGQFSYNWTASGGATILSGATGLNPLIGSGGLVTFVCFNAINGCQSTVSTNVPQNITFPIAIAGQNDTLVCLSNSLLLQGSGSGAPNLNYSWTYTSGGNIISGADTPTPLIDQPGFYTLTVENPVNGCTASDTVEILKDANAPNANAGISDTLTCNVVQLGLNAMASAGPDFSYQWSAAQGGNIMSGGNTLQPIVDQAGVYILSVTNSSNGCVATSSVTVPENVSPPVVDAGLAATLTCSTTNLNLNGSTSGGSAGYAWTTTNGNILSGQNTLNPLINQTGTYILTATLTGNGCTASDAVDILIDTLSPAFQLQPANLLTCVQFETPLTATVIQPGAANIIAGWSTLNGHFSAAQNTLNTSADAPGTYTLNLLNTQNGCNAQQQITVTQDTLAPVAVAAAANNLTCTLQSLSLDGTGSSSGSGFTYQWNTGGGLLLSGETTLNPGVGSAGNYTIVVRNTATGCTSTATTSVGTDTVPPVALIAPPALLTCTIDQLTLNGTGSSQGPSYVPSWSTNAGAILSGQGTYAVAINEPGVYTLTILNTQNGCTESAQTPVQENRVTPGALILPAPALHCNQTQLTLLGSSPTVGALTYNWSSASGGNILQGGDTPTPQIDAAGDYTLLVINPLNGCSSNTTIHVNAIPDPVFNPELVQPNCKIQTGALDFGPVSGGMAPFLFSTDGGQTATDQISYNDLEPGNYELVVQDANGCMVTETVTIDQPFLPVLDLLDVQKMEQGDSVLLSPQTNIPANQIESWTWSPPAGLSCTDCAEPWAKPLTNQYYTITVEDKNGCKAEDRILIQVSRKRHIYPPTAFTPNEDGENDRFTLYAKGVREIRRLAIYDRWGEEVFVRKNFQPNDDSLGWDGTFRGALLTPAVFVWAAEVEFMDGAVELIYGDVTVVR